jgi:peptidoglycan/LPS O-acetylase OafA/YrhL
MTSLLLPRRAAEASPAPAPASSLLPTSTPGTHIPALDGVRGLAILLVLVRHFSPDNFPQDSFGEPLIRWGRFGWMGVDLFFVLSGFLITGILLNARSKPHYFRNFYVRRVLRIFPLYYGVLLALLVVAPLLFSAAGLWPRVTQMLGKYADDYASIRANQIWLWLYAVNLVPGVEWSFLEGFWSLAVEEHFYLVWPFLVWCLRGRRLIVACVGCIVLALVIRVVLWATGWSGPQFRYEFTLCRMDCLALGALLAVLARNERTWAWLSRNGGWVALASAAALIAGFAWQGGPNYRTPLTSTIGLTVVALLCGGVLVMALRAPTTSLLGRTFRSGFLTFLGRYSYGLYVLHRLAAFPVRKLFTWDSVGAATGSPLLGVALYQVVAWTASIALALASWYLYESHFLKLKKYFE